jgi:hypothetical protein
MVIILDRLIFLAVNILVDGNYDVIIKSGAFFNIFSFKFFIGANLFFYSFFYDVLLFYLVSIH